MGSWIETPVVVGTEPITRGHVLHHPVVQAGRALSLARAGTQVPGAAIGHLWRLLQSESPPERWSGPAAVGPVVDPSGGRRYRTAGGGEVLALVDRDPGQPRCRVWAQIDSLTWLRYDGQDLVVVASDGVDLGRQ